MRSTFLRGTVLMASAALVLTACSSPGAEENATGDAVTADSGELTKVTVGSLKIVPAAGLHYGIENGIFEEHGLDVEIVDSNAGAAMLPAVYNQQIDIGVGNPLSVITAAEQGLDMKIFAGFCNSVEKGQDVAGVVARADAGIEGFADLEGQTVAINALKTLGDLTMMASVEAAGGDPEAIDFSEMPFPDMQAQLEQGNVDAVWLPEPFLSKALANEENALVGYSFQEAIPGMPPMVTFTSGGFAKENPETVETFKTALADVLEQADADTEGAKATLPGFLGIDAATADSLLMDPLDAELNRDHVRQIGEMAVKYGFIGSTPEPETLYLD